MKRLILALVVILISTNTLHAAKFNWKKISTNVEDGSIFYLDKNTTYKVGGYAYYWMLVDYFDDDDDADVKSSITHNMVKCNTFENKYITFTGFTEHRGKGDISLDFIVLEDVPDMFVWNKFPKNSTHGLVLKEVCKIW